MTNLIESYATKSSSVCPPITPKILVKDCITAPLMKIEHGKVDVGSFNFLDEGWNYGYLVRVVRQLDMVTLSFKI